MRRFFRNARVRLMLALAIVLAGGAVAFAASFTADSITVYGATTSNTFVNQCSGVQALTGGAATVTNSCISTSRPIICTDNTDTTAVTVTCVPSAGSLAIHGTGTDNISWAQF